MEIFIVVILIIVSVVKALNRQSQETARRKARSAEEDNTPPARRPVILNRAEEKKEAEEASAPGTFWQQMSEMLSQTAAQPESAPQPAPEDGHGAVSVMPEGDSRACEHGSVGGSIAYESHEGGRVAPEEIKRLGRFVATEAEDARYEPFMDARQMRQAIVVAEILKRPAERRAEQARRWNLR